ncbi:hypothetical protein GCM10022393_10520 [Aquimarina addita]|uniref:Uncharacterized protein n=1 Tax=Aquimarina addita TaxID=870485 RepID=A0ABP7XD55_9FLAO
MKYAEYIIDANKVEFFNSVIGVEEVFINNEKISSKFSLFGKQHFFTIGDDNYGVNAQIDLTGISVKVHKNGVPVELKNKHKIGILPLIALGIFGFVIGIASGYFLMH